MLAMMADNIEHVVSYWLLFQKFHSPTLAGFAEVSHWTPFLLLSVYFGGIADRYDCRKVIQIAQIMFMGVSAFWLLLAVTFFFADGGFAIVGPYAAEVWPSHLRTSGMGSAYGFGGIGKIIGPVGLALIVGSNNYLKPDVPLTQIPTAFVYLGCWFLMAGIVYYFIGFETRGKSIEQIDKELADGLDLSTARVRQA